MTLQPGTRLGPYEIESLIGSGLPPDLMSSPHSNVWTIPAVGGSPTQLTHFDDREIVDFDWSPDGTRLAVARRLETTDIILLQGLRRETP